jgi:hypothetical protein
MAVCPHCGGPIDGAVTDAIAAQHAAQTSAISSAISTQNGRIAHGSEASTKDGRQAYNQDYPEDFLAFWEIYPRHRDKRKALTQWRSAIRRAAIDDINAGATRYRNDPNRVEEFTKYAATWLAADGWLDEPLPPRGQTRLLSIRPDPPRATQTWEAGALARQALGEE